MTLKQVSTLVIDGDDTLWLTEHLYDNARTQCRKLVERSGIDGSLWEITERELDVSRVESEGLSRFRFPESCRLAYKAISGKKYEPEVARAIVHTASQVFKKKAPLVPRARATLRQLGKRRILILLTAGDSKVQVARTMASGLAEYFSEIHIVPRKTQEVFNSMSLQLNTKPSNICSIGNSVRSDIRPALEAGFFAIFVPSHVWEFEYESSLSIARHKRVSVVESLSAIPDVI